MSHESIPEKLEYINALRDQDEISSLNYAIETVKLYAEHRDMAQPVIEGPSNVQIVDTLLQSESDITTSYAVGYYAKALYPIRMSTESKHAFMKVFRIEYDQKPQRFYIGDNIRSETFTAAVTEHCRSVGYSGDAKEHPLHHFGNQIVAAHAIYRHVNKRVNHSMQAGIDGEHEVKVLPGSEEKFWRSRIFGSKGNPGIYESKGSLARIYEHINIFAHSEYGEKADQYISAWWAVLNIPNPLDGETFKSTMNPIIDALLKNDIGSANMLIKEYLYLDKDVVLHRSRAKYALDDDELDFFNELHAPVEATVLEPVVVTDSEKQLTRTDALDQTVALIGSIARIGERVALVRRLGLFKRTISDGKLVENTDGSLDVPYAAYVDYGSIENGIFAVANKACGRAITIETFADKLQKGEIVELHRNDAYLDQAQKRFVIDQ